jgi:hypothetical protein
MAKSIRSKIMKKHRSFLRSTVGAAQVRAVLVADSFALSSRE